VMLARFASAVLAPEVRSQAVNWIGDAFTRCGSSCSADFEDLRLELSKSVDSVVLTITQR